MSASSKKTGRGMTRRRFLAGTVAGTATVITAPYIIPRARAAEQIVVVSWGGRYRERIEKAFVTPFMEETGIDVVVSDTPDFAKAKAQVESGNVEWDVFDAIGSHATSGEKLGLWEPLDTSIVDTSSLHVEATESVIGFYLWAGGIAWVPSRTGEGEHPRNFHELWNTDAYPGRRALRARPYEAFEMALVADGVPPNELYPLDIDRAFESLNRIKDSIAKWTKATPKTIEHLRTNEVDFSYTYSGRVATAQAEGVDIDMSMDQTCNGTEYLTVLKGTKRREAAMRFVEFCLRPDRQAAFANLYHGVTPMRTTALPQVEDEARRWLPDLSAPQNVILDDFWWGENRDRIEERFKEWMLT
jgi:putative spermidine/putrescine transport system substrate-binding protein